MCIAVIAKRDGGCRTRQTGSNQPRQTLGKYAKPTQCISRLKPTCTAKPFPHLFTKRILRQPNLHLILGVWQSRQPRPYLVFQQLHSELFRGCGIIQRHQRLSPHATTTSAHTYIRYNTCESGVRCHMLGGEAAERRAVAIGACRMGKRRLSIAETHVLDTNSGHE